jgi:FkbM family methyltransferase
MTIKFLDYLRHVKHNIERRRNRREELGRLLSELGISSGRRPIVFDVGANDGRTFNRLQELSPRAVVYAFEPTPELVYRIQAEKWNNSNYLLVPHGVGDIPGPRIFNVAGHADWGCSSFLEFADDLQETWPGRDDFRVTHQLLVNVIRLDDFILQNRVSQIDFLHVDTQGTDLRVLRSLGDEAHRVRAGVIEVPLNDEVMLYKDGHTREEVERFLGENGFCVWKVESQQNELNLFYRRR